MGPILSIVIPAYNNLSLFVNAVSSIHKQTVLPTEIIVSDDSNTDDIKIWCENHNSHGIIKYCKNKDKRGAVANWNNGISKASGEWIIVMHHDEELGSSNYIEQLAKYTCSSELIISDIRVKTENQIRRGKINGIVKKLMIKIPVLCMLVNPIGPCACIAFKKDKNTYFDDKLVWFVDMEWYYRLLKKSEQSKYIPNLTIVSNHGHSDQITENINIIEKSNKDIEYLKTKYNSYLGIKVILTLNKMLQFLKR